MDASNTDFLPTLEGDMAIFAKREVKLADLVAFGEVGVEVIFAVEFREQVDLTVEAERNHYAPFDSLLIRDRESAR